MKLSRILSEDRITLSFEVFPPKTEDTFEAVASAIEEIARLQPDFMSVTYGAGGGTSVHTVSIASNLQNNLKVNALAHLTCATTEKSKIKKILEQLKANGIENILALRGDYPENYNVSTRDYFKYAAELIQEIKLQGDFCIGGACYPEGHPDSIGKKEDILYLKEKVESGCEFLTTQMFFDNNIFYNFLYRIREKDVKVPIIAGIMPVTSKSQMKKIGKITETKIPNRFLALLDRFGDNPKAMKQAGIAFATEQIIDLIANGVDHIHVYSMNRPDVAAAIKSNLSEILNS